MPRPLNGTVRSILAKRDEFVRTAMWSRKIAWGMIARRDSELTKRLQTAGAAIVEIHCNEQTTLQRLVDRT